MTARARKHKRATYPTYKPSGVAWLGDVPEHWEVRRLKYTADLVNVKVDGADNDLPYTGLEHIESWTGKRFTPNGESTSEGEANLYRRGDVLFGKLRPYLAKAYAADSDGVCTGELLVLRPQYVIQRFLLGYMLNTDFVSVVDSSTYGAKMPRANWDFIGNLPALIPPLDEQRAIAAFLDRETARIDALIEKKRRQIELLQEKRAALISHAVTKGLNPNAPMKDSGIEWLGQIPAHWERKRLKHVTSHIVDCIHATPDYIEDGAYPAIRTADVSPGRLDLKDARRVDEESFRRQISRLKPKPMDIVYSREGERFGMAALVPIGCEVCISQRMMLFRALSGIVKSDFLMWQLNASIVYRQAEQDVIGATSPHVNVETIRNFWLAVPPIQEQRAIADVISSGTEHTDCTSERISKGIEALREYRTALISAAVTGKIDVRNSRDPHESVLRREA